MNVFVHTKDGRTLKVKIPRKWRDGEIRRFATFVATQIEKREEKEDYHLSRKGKKDSKTTHISNEATPLSVYIFANDEIRLEDGKGPAFVTPAERIRQSYAKWDSFEEEEKRDDDCDETTEAKKNDNQTAKSRAIEEIVRWTEETERMRKILKRQWTSDAPVTAGSLPFKKLAKSTWKAASPKERALALARGKHLFMESHLKPFKDLSRSAKLAVLGAVTRDPESYPTEADKDGSLTYPIVDLFQMIAEDTENAETRKPHDGIRDFLRRQRIPSEAIDGTPAALQRTGQQETLVEWLLTLRSLFLTHLACCYASLLTYTVRGGSAS
eukprot:g776.t1